MKKLGKKVKEHAGEIISAVGGAVIAAGVIAAGGPAAAGVAFWAGYTAASKGSSYSVGLKNDKVKIDDILKLEQQKKELCDKSESLRKQEIIYDKSTMVGINGLSFIVAPYAGQYTSSMIYSQMPMFAETAGYAYPAIVNYTGNAIGYGIQATSSAGMLMNTSDAVEEYTGKNYLRDGLGVSKDVYDSAEETFNTISVYSVITGAVSYQPQQYAVEYPRTNSISSYTGMVNGGSKSVDDFISKNVHPSFQKNVKEAFENDVKVTILEKDTVVYRYHGGSSSGKSYWYTPNQTSNPASDLALPQGNTYEYMDTYIIPKGTTIIEGTVAPNFGQPGGGYQFYVPDPNVVKDY